MLYIAGYTVVATLLIAKGMYQNRYLGWRASELLVSELRGGYGGANSVLCVQPFGRSLL